MTLRAIDSMQMDDALIGHAQYGSSPDNARLALAAFIERRKPPIALVVWLERMIETKGFVIYGDAFRPVPEDDAPTLEAIGCGIEKANGVLYGEWPRRAPMVVQMQRCRCGSGDIAVHDAVVKCGTCGGAKAAS